MENAPKYSKQPPLRWPTQVACHWPRVLCYRRGSTQVPAGGGILGDNTGEFPKGFRKHSQTHLKRTFSNSIIHAVPKNILKLWDFRKRPETFDMIIDRNPLLESLVGVLRGTVLQGQGAGLHVLWHSGGPYWAVACGSKGCSRAPLDYTFSETIIHVTPEMHLKPKNFRKPTKTFETTPALMPRST